MKRFLSTLIVMMMLIVGCGSTSTKPEPTSTPIATPTPVPTPSFNMADYKKQAKELYEIIYKDCEILASMGTFYSKVMIIKLNGGLKAKITPEDLEAAYLCIEDTTDATRDTLKDNYNKVQQLYKEFYIIENDNSKEATKIEDDISEIYEAYKTLYKCMTTTGDANTNLNEASESANKITEISEEITLFLGE